MIELRAEPRFRLPIYNGTAGGSLCRRCPSWLVTVVALVPLALASSACSYKLDSVFSRDAEKSETGASPGFPGRAAAAPGSAEADLASAIRAVTAGKSFFSPDVSKILLEDYMRKLKRTGAEDSFYLLSPREREVLQLVAEGKSSKEVANLLSLSVYTVETHRAKVMQKLNLHNIPELILYAVRKGVIS